MGTIQSHLTDLEHRSLVQVAQLEPDLEYIFRHALVQDAAYGSLLKQDRKRLHHSVAATLEHLFPLRLEELAPLLAMHFDRAGLDERSLHYFALAGDSAARRSANAEAVTHYTRAIE